MGASKLTLGRWGCTTTGISMLSDYFGDYKSPEELASNAHNYTRDGLVLWWNLKFDKMKFVKRSRSYNEAEVHAALKDPDQGVLLAVNDDAHWVVAYSTRMFSGKLAVADPWTGKIEKASKFYNISGAAFFSRKGEKEVVPKIKKAPLELKPSKKLIKGDENGKIYYYNGSKKFHFPNWYTFIELGGTMGNVETLPQFAVDDIPSGKAITSIKP